MFWRVCALALLVGAAGCAKPQSAGPAPGSLQQGDFVVEPVLPSSACSSGSLARQSLTAQRIFYKGQLVTAVALMPVFSPYNPARVLYTAACSKDGTESGTFYFGEGLRAPLQVNPLGMYEAPKDFDLYWSRDDKYVIVRSTEGQLTLANLQNGEHSKFLEELFESKHVWSSGVGVLGWAPDGKNFSIMVTSRYLRDDRSVYSDYDLLSIDPVTLKSDYVATIRREGWNGETWYDGKSAWKKGDGKYELVVNHNFQSDPALYRKTR